jgi:predicted GIY-YIG superfamily endonuclease
MSPEFQEAVESLHPMFERLMDSAPYAKGATLPKQGVYLFCENGKALYVGRSNNIPRRRRQHTQRGSQTNQAALATLMARDETKRLAYQGRRRLQYPGRRRREEQDDRRPGSDHVWSSTSRFARPRARCDQSRNCSV